MNDDIVQPTDRPLTQAVLTRDLDGAIEQYKQRGFRLDMIKPADAPREAFMSNAGEQILLKGDERRKINTDCWITGRAGMEYRDLIPDRLGGKVIASHIRLTAGGEVPDYVHYHNISFQMIYCWRGRVRVVYEDQGEPFWLEAGDCVLQPPKIRHRVLECLPGTEVIEVSSPSVHETWLDHDMALPTGSVRPERDFGGQRFVRHIATESQLTVVGSGGFEVRDLGIGPATNGRARALVLRAMGAAATFRSEGSIGQDRLLFQLQGSCAVVREQGVEHDLTIGDGLVIPSNVGFDLLASSGSQLLWIEL